MATPLYLTFFTLILIARPSGILIRGNHEFLGSIPSGAIQGIRRTPLRKQTPKANPEVLWEPSMHSILVGE
jgi:hypothetical protein